MKVVNVNVALQEKVRSNIYRINMRVMAEETGVNYSAIKSFSSGRTTYMQDDSIVRLAKYMENIFK